MTGTIPKVERLQAAAARGFRIRSMHTLPSGALHLILVRGQVQMQTRFEHYELPAVLMLTRPRPHAS